MRNLVNSQKEILVCSCSDDISCQKEPPRQEFGVFDEIGGGNLYRDDEEDNPFCEGFMAAELRNLYRMTVGC